MLSGMQKNKCFDNPLSLSTPNGSTNCVEYFSRCNDHYYTIQANCNQKIKNTPFYKNIKE